jgi:tubulin polyglutamylase TTLL6/13
LDGLKFDLRIYVLLKSISPLKVFVYKEGLARFSTVKYEKPTGSNSNDMCMHLTNYAVNKMNPNFVYNLKEANDDVGHKRSLTSVLKNL